MATSTSRTLSFTKLFTSFVFLSSQLVSAAPPSYSSSHQAGKRAIGYYGNWFTYGRDFQPDDVQVNILTHVMYSFGNVNGSTGEVYLSDTFADTDKRHPGDSDKPGNNVYGNVQQFFRLKEKNRNMKVMFSIGGYTYAYVNRVFANCTQPGYVDTFAKSSVKLVKDLGFDGLDVDWEYPEDLEQGKCWTTLLKAIRKELDVYSATLPGKPHFLLTVASPAGPQHYKLMDIKGMDKVLDFWNLMAYDYSGGWELGVGPAGHSSNLYFSKKNPKSTPYDTMDPLEYMLQQGVASDKINLGMPLYGRSFTGTDGPGTNFTGLGAGTWETGVYDYKALPLNGSTEYYDPAIGAAWSYDNATRHFISYDTPQSARQKIALIEDRKLGGAMWWEVSADRPQTDPRSLIALTVRTLGGPNGNRMEQVQNVLNYPESQYDNIRNSS